MKFRIVVFLFIYHTITLSQNGSVNGYLKDNGKALEFATVAINNSSLGINTNNKGYYKIDNIPFGTYELVASVIGYEVQKK